MGRMGEKESRSALVLACVAGVNGEGEGEQERGRRGTGARDEGTPATKTPFFHFCFR